MSFDNNTIFGTYNTFYSRTGGTNGYVVLQAGPNESLLLPNATISSGTFTNLVATNGTITSLTTTNNTTTNIVSTNGTITNLVATSGSINSLTVGTLNGLVTGLPTSVTITQTNHGFSIGQWLYLNGSVYTLADATSTNTAEVVGVVTKVIDNSTFVLQDTGYVSGLSGLSAGTVYWLSTASGALTTSQPTNIGLVSKPLLVADGATSGYFTNYRGELMVSPASTQTIGSLYISTNIIVGSTTAAGGASTGSLVTFGGVGIANSTASTSTITGALVVAGGIGASGLNVTTETVGNSLISSTTKSSSTATGALVIQGGLGLKGDFYQGGLSFLGNGRALYTATSAQTITSGVGGTVLFLATDYNTFGGNLTYTTNGSTFTNTSGTTLFLNCSYSFRFNAIPVAAATNPGYGNGWIQINGAGIFYAQGLFYTPTSLQLGVTGSEIIRLANNDNLQVFAFQQNTAGTGVAISGNGGANATTFSIYQLP